MDLSQILLFAVWGCRVITFVPASFMMRDTRRKRLDAVILLIGFMARTMIEKHCSNNVWRVGDTTKIYCVLSKRTQSKQNHLLLIRDCKIDGDDNDNAHAIKEKRTEKQNIKKINLLPLVSSCSFRRWNACIVAGANVQFRHITDKTLIRHFLTCSINHCLKIEENTLKARWESGSINLLWVCHFYYRISWPQQRILAYLSAIARLHPVEYAIVSRQYED